MKLEDVIVVTVNRDYIPPSSKLIVPYVLVNAAQPYLKAIHRAICQVWRRNFDNCEVSRPIAGMKVGELTELSKFDEILNQFYMSRDECDYVYSRGLNPLKWIPNKLFLWGTHFWKNGQLVVDTHMTHSWKRLDVVTIDIMQGHGVDFAP